MFHCIQIIYEYNEGEAKGRQHGKVLSLHVIHKLYMMITCLCLISIFIWHDLLYSKCVLKNSTTHGFDPSGFALIMYQVLRLSGFPFILYQVLHLKGFAFIL